MAMIKDLVAKMRGTTSREQSHERSGKSKSRSRSRVKQGWGPSGWGWYWKEEDVWEDEEWHKGWAWKYRPSFSGWSNLHKSGQAGTRYERRSQAARERRAQRGYHRRQTGWEEAETATALAEPAESEKDAKEEAAKPEPALAEPDPPEKDAKEEPAKPALAEPAVSEKDAKEEAAANAKEGKKEYLEKDQVPESRADDLDQPDYSPDGEPAAGLSAQLPVKVEKVEDLSTLAEPVVGPAKEETTEGDAAMATPPAKPEGEEQADAPAPQVEAEQEAEGSGQPSASGVEAEAPPGSMVAHKVHNLDVLGVRIGVISPDAHIALQELAEAAQAVPGKVAPKDIETASQATPAKPKPAAGDPAAVPPQPTKGTGLEDVGERTATKEPLETLEDFPAPPDKKAETPHQEEKAMTMEKLDGDAKETKEAENPHPEKKAETAQTLDGDTKETKEAETPHQEEKANKAEKLDGDAKKEPEAKADPEVLNAMPKSESRKTDLEKEKKLANPKTKSDKALLEQEAAKQRLTKKPQRVKPKMWKNAFEHAEEVRVKGGNGQIISADESSQGTIIGQAVQKAL
ncbi:unnamed protein product [Durusdinium trenchii]|uniref:Uncharacterized protein n=1 Tax=Durusdinium trenchii TaxID=1381693 RepID=A0ABP0LU36_9DINO